MGLIAQGGNSLIALAECSGERDGGLFSVKNI